MATQGASVPLAYSMGPDGRGFFAAVAAPVLLAATPVQTSAGDMLAAEVRVGDAPSSSGPSRHW